MKSIISIVMYAVGCQNQKLFIKIHFYCIRATSIEWDMLQSHKKTVVVTGSKEGQLVSFIFAVAISFINIYTYNIKLTNFVQLTNELCFSSAPQPSLPSCP